MLPLLPQPASPNPYKVRERRMIYDSPWIRLREDRFDHRRGTPGRYAVCGFRRTACGVLALDGQDRVVLVGQWRYPLEQYSWELPEGGGEADESPFEAIRRELGEEAGLQAQVWEPLLYFNPSNATTDEETFLFLATGLSVAEGHEPDEHEELMLHHEPFQDCVQRVFSGEIRDGLTVAALLALQARRAGAATPLDPALAERFFQRPAEHPSPGRARWDDMDPEAGSRKAGARA
ncbi:MAG TPA: NUDIX hydrolase [Holophagaceae bacterium]|nr:NUDIX hydrolase [Holophagaceae bacterium]